MKRNLLAAFVLLIAISSCKKDKPVAPEVEERKPEVLIKDITTKLSTADSISTFTAAFKSIALTTEETAQGITIFAPLNQSAAQQGQLSRVSSVGGSIGKAPNTISAVADTSSTALTDEVLRDHIVKGVYNFADLTNGRMLAGLSGKQLKVTRVADTVWINGIRIGGKQIVAGSNEAVYAVKSNLSGTTVTDELQSTSLEITVWDATAWSTTKPKGDLAAAATVVLYRTRQNYADSVSAYQGVTDASGKLTFKSITAGTYYIKVMSGTKSNIFNRSRQGGLYVGYANAGIFQTQAEITAAATQTGAAPGDFKWLDANGDGMINDNDKVTLPYENAAVTSGTLKKVSISIGALKNTQPQPFTESEFNSALTAAEANVAVWQKKLALIDGLLSRQAVTDSIPAIYNTAQYQAFNNYTVNESNPLVGEIWQQGYQSISALTNLQQRAPVSLINRDERLARVRATRAYIYLQLLTYYGNISLLQNPGNFNNSSRPAVYNYIVAELQAASNALPATVTGAAANLNGLAVRGLLARAALLDKKYADVVDLTEQVINSTKYALAAMGAQFNTNSAEIIWDNSTNIDANIKSYFLNRATLPYLRFTEVCLMAAEANLSLGNVVKAQSLYTMLKQRAGDTNGTVTIANLRSLWSNEMYREGNVFASMVRWETALQNLSFRGFTAKNIRLPIPASVLTTNPGMIQNPGY